MKITTQVLEQAEDETEFELLTAIGMLYFVKAGCYVVVLETGLGGRLDPTNVIDAPEVAVITNIGLEHTEVLGDTLEKIAAEKAGIIKPGCDVVLYKQGQEVTNVVEQVCRTQGAALHIAEPAKALSAGLEGQTFTWRNSGPYWLFLPGEYQLRNAAVALETLRALACRGWCIPERSIEVGLSKMFFWCGRLDRVRRNPDVILDGGHNPQSMEALGQSLKGLYPGKKLIFLTGVLANKDYPAMMEELLPLAKEFFTVAPDSPRALPARELADCLESRGGRAVPCETLQEGLDRALAAAGTDDVVCVCGSLYMIGEAWDLLRRC